MDYIYWHSYDEYSDSGQDYLNWTYDQDGLNRISSSSDFQNHILRFDGYGPGSSINCYIDGSSMGDIGGIYTYGASSTVFLSGTLSFYNNYEQVDVYIGGSNAVTSYLSLDFYDVPSVKIQSVIETRISKITLNNCTLEVWNYFGADEYELYGSSTITDGQGYNSGVSTLFFKSSENRLITFSGDPAASCEIQLKKFTIYGGVYNFNNLFNNYTGPTVTFPVYNSATDGLLYIYIYNSELSTPDINYFQENNYTIPFNVAACSAATIILANTTTYDLSASLPQTYPNTTKGLFLSIDNTSIMNLNVPNSVSYLTGLGVQIPEYTNGSTANIQIGNDITINGNLSLITYPTSVNSKLNVSFGNNVLMSGSQTTIRVGETGAISGTYDIAFIKNSLVTPYTSSYYVDPSPVLVHPSVSVDSNALAILGTSMQCDELTVNNGATLKQVNGTSISASNLDFSGTKWSSVLRNWPYNDGGTAYFDGLTSNVTVNPGTSVENINASGGFEVYAIGATDISGNINFLFGELFRAPPTRPFLVRVSAIPSTDNSASLQIPQGITPTNIENGDTWVTSGGAFMQINGEVKNLDNTWGTITGDISAQSDLYTSINSKVNNTTLSSITGNFQYQINTLSINSIGISSTNDNVGIVWDGVIGNGYGIYAFYEKQVTNRWSTIGYGNKTFVALANGNVADGVNNQLAMKSTDGKTWNLINTPTELYYPVMNDVAYGNNTFVVGGFNYGNDAFVMRSTNNGDSWAVATTPTISSNSSVVSLSYGNGAFVGVVVNGTANSKIIRSTDNGVNWAQIGSNPVDFYSSAGAGIAFGNGRFVAVGGDITGNGLVMSSDTSGSTWTNAVTISGAGILKDVAYGDNKFVAISNEKIVISYDYGINWAIAKTLPFTGMTITFGNGLFIYTDDAGSSGGIYVSKDGTLYTKSRKSSDIFRTSTNYATCYGNGLLVAVTKQLGDSYFDDKLLTSGEVTDTNIGSTYPVFSNLYSSGTINAEKGVSIKDSETLPSAIGASTMFVSGGALYFKGSLGTITKIANA